MLINSVCSLRVPNSTIQENRFHCILKSIKCENRKHFHVSTISKLRLVSWELQIWLCVNHCREYRNNNNNKRRNNSLKCKFYSEIGCCKCETHRIAYECLHAQTVCVLSWLVETACLLAGKEDLYNFVQLRVFHTLTGKKSQVTVPWDMLYFTINLLNLGCKTQIVS